MSKFLMFSEKNAYFAFCFSLCAHHNGKVAGLGAILLKMASLSTSASSDSFDTVSPLITASIVNNLKDNTSVRSNYGNRTDL